MPSCGWYEKTVRGHSYYFPIQEREGEEGSFYSGAVRCWTDIKMTRRRIDTYHHNESRYADGAKTGENALLAVN